MEKLKKENLRLIGSAPTMQMLVEMIEQRMFWQVVNVSPSVNYSYGRKQCFDVETSKGVNKGVVIAKEASRYKLYLIHL